VKGLRGRVGLVTGAAQGIGLGIAMRFAEEGMAVALLDINTDAVNAAARAVADATGARALALAVDVSDERAVRDAIADTTATLGSLDALINNAGVDISSAPETMTKASWSKVHDVDLWAPMLLVREAAPALARARGAVVNIASTHAFVTEPGRAAYAAAKAGVTGLTRALALDLGARGIRVNAVLPGYVRTPIWKLWLDAAPDPEALVAQIGAQHAVGRVGTPADVAGLVAFLCSDDAGFITGGSFLVDGGYTVQARSPSA
jgi:NAD(P)-dependent dehydrogenase (short-subunit alcohol dehydrogenase family)